MATLANDACRSYEQNIDPMYEDLPVIASDIIYEGAAVGDNASGYMRPLTSGDPFRGFADARVDNSSGAAGDLRVNLRRHGVVQLAVTGASAVTDVGKPVYATDDDTFTLTPGGTRIGTVARWVTSTTCLVHFVADQIRHPAALGGRALVVEKTADYTVVAADNGKIFTTTGASGAVAFTLPAAAAALVGMRVTFLNTVDQNLTVQGTAGELIFLNDLAANSVAFSTSSEKIGGGFIATCVSSSKWFIEPIADEAQTVTVAT